MLYQMILQRNNDGEHFNFKGYMEIELDGLLVTRLG